MVHLLRASLLSLFLAVIYSGNVQAQGLAAYPSTLNFALVNGQSEAQNITMSNNAGKKIQVRLYLNDWVRDSVGGHAYYEPNTLDRSCSRWITLSNNFIELEPGQSTQISVRLQLPDSASAVSQMKWAMLFIETVEEQNSAAAKQAQATVRNLMRIGVHIYQTPPTLLERQVKVLDLVRVPGDNKVWALSCQNTGQVMIECKSYLELTATDGTKTKVEVSEFPMFPSQKRLVMFNLPPDLKPGKYSALAVLDGGEDMPLEAVESEITLQ